VAEIVSELLGHRVRYLHLPARLFELLLRAGVPAWTARGLRHQFVDVVRRGHDNGRRPPTRLRHSRSPTGQLD
jgi:hypothetical protein